MQPTKISTSVVYEVITIKTKTNEIRELVSLIGSLLLAVFLKKEEAIYGNI